MKKRLVLILMAITIVIGIAGCGKDVSQPSSKPPQGTNVSSNELHNETKLDDSNSVKVPIAIFDSEDFEHKADSFKKIGYLRIPNECVVDFSFVDENGNRDYELTGHDESSHIGAWSSAKECADNGDFDKDYVYIGNYAKPDYSDAVMISSTSLTQEDCDDFLGGNTFKSYLDDTMTKNGKEHLRIINVNGHELYVRNGWSDDEQEYIGGPICYYFVDDNTYLEVINNSNEYTSDEDVDRFAQYVFRGFEIAD